MFRWFFFKAKKPYGVPKQYRSLTPPKSDPKSHGACSLRFCFCLQLLEAAKRPWGSHETNLSGRKSKSTRDYPLPKTNSRWPLKSYRDPIGKDRLPTINFTGAMLVSGREFVKEGILIIQNWWLLWSKPQWHFIESWLFNRDPYNMFIIIPM